VDHLEIKDLLVIQAAQVAKVQLADLVTLDYQGPLAQVVRLDHVVIQDYRELRDSLV